MLPGTIRWGRQMTPDDGFDLTLDEAGQMLHVSRTTLERWARDGRIPSQLTAEGVRVFSRRDLSNRSVTLACIPPRGDRKGGDGAK